MSEPYGVIVSPHATKRLKERFADLGRRDPIGLIFYEVHHALEAGRRSKTKPAWASPGPRKKSGGDDHRYVWNEECSRAYILQRVRSDDPGRWRFTWVVKTVLPHVDFMDDMDKHRHRFHLMPQRPAGRKGKGKRR